MDYLEQALQNAKFFSALGLPHVIRSSNSTVRLEPEGGKPMVFTDNLIPRTHLNFIRRVKDGIRQSAAFGAMQAELPKYRPGVVAYIKDAGKQPGYYENVVELDINGAYWTCAYMLGYLPKKLYLEGICRGEDGELIRPKMVRLIALGAMARSRTVREYYPDMGEYVYKGLDYNETEGGVFFHIAHTVGNVLNGCSEYIGANNLFLFWVDAMIVKRATVPFVSMYMRDAGYSVKEKPLEYLEVKEDKRGRVAYTKEVKTGREKFFCLASNRDRTEFEDFIRNIKA